MSQVYFALLFLLCFSHRSSFSGDVSDRFEFTETEPSVEPNIQNSSNSYPCGQSLTCESGSFEDCSFFGENIVLEVKMLIFFLCINIPFPFAVRRTIRMFI
jgi:hypothetical protein